MALVVAAGGAGYHRHDEFVESGTIRISKSSRHCRGDGKLCSGPRECPVASVILSSPFPYLLDADEDAFTRVFARCVSILNSRRGSCDAKKGGVTRLALIGGGVWELVAAARLDAIAQSHPENDDDGRTFTTVLKVLAQCLREMVVALLINAGHDTKFPSGLNVDAPVANVDDSACYVTCQGDSVGVVHRLQSMLETEDADTATIAKVQRILLDAVDGTLGGDTYKSMPSVFDDIETRISGISNAVAAVDTIRRGGICLTNGSGML